MFTLQVYIYIHKLEDVLSLLFLQYGLKITGTYLHLIPNTYYKISRTMFPWSTYVNRALVLGL